MDITFELRRAIAEHRAGKLEDAQRRYRGILAIQPDQIETLHALGVLAGQKGEVETAVELIRRAIRLKPDFVEAYTNLGRILAEKGRSSEAVEAYAQVVRLRPGNAEALNHLGIALRIDGRVDEAISAYQRAIQADPSFGDAHHNLGGALFEKGFYVEAAAECGAAAQLRPQAPNYWFSLGESLSAGGHFNEAIIAYERAIALAPTYYEAHAKRGVALAELDQSDAAIESHIQALKFGGETSLNYEALGSILWKKGAVVGAVESFRRAISIDEREPTVWNALGTALNALGEFEEAAACFRKALELRPRYLLAYRNLAGTGRSVADAEEVKRLKALLTAPDLAVDDRISAGFALGKILDESDEFDEAFATYSRANSLVKAKRRSEGDVFDKDILRTHVDKLIDTFTPAFFEKHKDWGVADELPVFIVGMPRSGTTLVEQIAASHPEVVGAGELKGINRIAAEAGRDWLKEQIFEAAKSHLGRLHAMGPIAKRVIDKMMGNALHLGLIAVLFPRARVIHVRRDARDNCLSCYFHWFAKGNTFVYDLADCAHQYLEMERIMAHWRRVLGLPILTVQYENLVADLEGQSRRLIEFLGLDWNDACLNYHLTRRAVLTESVWQVRQPIYTSSVGRWKHYGKHLGLLMDVLGDARI